MRPPSLRALVPTQAQRPTLTRPTSSRVRCEVGASLVEYALLIALIAVVCFAAVMVMGRSTDTTFSRIGDSMEAAT